MSRIVFIENRSKTTFWERVAHDLVANGHEIFWLVQNPVYSPNSFNSNVIRIDFPKRSQLKEESVPDIVERDRGRIYFGNGSLHYSYYSDEIQTALNHICPDAVIGESTLFHELIAIDHCKRNNVPYFHPTMARYPQNRFQIFLNDSQSPIESQKHGLDDITLESISSDIFHGRVHPQYMQRITRVDSLLRKFNLLRNQARTTIGWIAGERYNTPSPFKKLALNWKHRILLKQWNTASTFPSDDSEKVVLYPLQMQPEANIDTWGRPYSDQSKVVRDILSALPAHAKLAIKPNPKPKYEMSNELLDLGLRDERVFLLPLDMSMQQAQSLSLGTITVSGTVGLEAIFGRGRCISMRHPILREHFPRFHADNPFEAVDMLFKYPNCGVGSIQDGKHLLSLLFKSSFEGTVNEPTFDKKCMSQKNINFVSKAIDFAISSYFDRSVP